MKIAGLGLWMVVLLFVLHAGSALAQGDPTVARQQLSLDRNWKFHLGDIPFPVIQGQKDSYNNAKAGTAHAAAGIKFDDKAWRVLDLPHDWACESDYSAKNNLSQGYRARGFGWYRRYFKLESSDNGKHLELQFDGVSTNCTIWVNGLVAHRNWCGYTGFSIDITPFAKYGNNQNVIAVHVDADAQEGWWYEGAGIYRHTWLVKSDPVHIVTDGVYANPMRNADGTWTLPIEVTLGSSAHEAATVEVESTLLDPAGKTVGTAKAAAVDIAPFQEKVAKYAIAVTAPTLWSLETPVLYEVCTVVKRDGKEIDGVNTHCGFRTIRFDANEGFFLNDKHVKLKGTCNHQDHAGVGVAVPDSLWEYRVRRLKEMGSNAFRCSHNPPATAFLEQCDRQGLLVMDENRNFNPTDEYTRQLQWMVRRDRNHPSIILWSVFNEEPMQGSVQGYEMVRKMAAVVKSLDATRPVTAAQSGAMMHQPNASQAADVAGFNYQIGGYDAYHKAFPNKPITSSEDTSAVMTRGEYVTDHTKCLIDSYDTQAQPWGATHGRAWKAIDERPFLAGGFVWTGFDYRGETQPLQWPAASSSFGCMDLCGFPKAAYYIHQAQWMRDRPMVQLIPHWNWKGQEGKPIKVKAITNADTVALILNGKSLGEKPVDKYEFVTWEVPYEAGTLEAVAKKGGAEVARCAVETTGEPAAIELMVDRPRLAGDGWDAQPINVQVVDDKGRVVPGAGNLVKFEISGPGAIIGVGNGDPTCHESEKGQQRSVFHGLAQVIVQSTRGSGKFVLHAHGRRFETNGVDD